jgi:hypothetical protein
VPCEAPFTQAENQPRQAQSKLRALTHGWEIAKFIVLDSADIIFFAPALAALILGVISLVVGTLATSGVEVGRAAGSRCSGGILIPGATA